MFRGLFGKKEEKPAAVSHLLVNTAPQHKYLELAKHPETQLLIVLPKAAWERALQYIPQYEDVRLAGRFGADPGDFEWEILTRPHSGLKWWRRTYRGDPFYCGAAFVAVNGDNVELYGFVDIGEDTPWWRHAIEDEGSMQRRAALLSREKGIAEESAEQQLIRDQYRGRKLLTIDSPNTVAFRRGSLEETNKLKEAILELIERARTAVLLSEI